MEDEPDEEDSRTKRTMWGKLRSNKYAVTVTIAALALLVAVASLTRDVTEFTVNSTFSSISITVDQADTHKVSWCTEINGSVPDQENATLWIAIRDRDITEPRFFLVKATHVPGSGRWDKNIRVGDEKEDVEHTLEIYAFFVNNDVSDFIDNLHVKTFAETNDAYFFFSSLPPKVNTKPLMIVTRTAEKGQCS